MPSKPAKKSVKKTTISAATTKAAKSLRNGILQRSTFEELAGKLIVWLAESDPTAEILLHVPHAMLQPLNRRIAGKEQVKSGAVYIGKTEGSTRNWIFKSVGTLLPRHTLRREFLLLGIGEQVRTLLIAKTRESTKRGRRSIDQWQTSLSFDDKLITSATKLFEKAFRDSRADLKAATTWITRCLSKPRKRNAGADSNNRWGNFVADLTFGLEQHHHQRENKLRWYQALSTVQDAVGWELNTGNLFGSICDVLKSSIGFHYLEIQIIEMHSGKIEVTAAHHRNDTSYGGPLLTVILKQRAQAAILRNGKPVLMTTDMADELLMNPRLMNLMGFRSGVIVPLINEGRFNGLLKLFSQDEKNFTAEDLDLLDAISGILARSIENVKEHTLLRRMATIDGLTNLYNRRFFMEQLLREFKRARRYRSSLTLIMIDIDHFKKFNDLYGHLQGDEILRTIADIMKASVREVDMVGRYGGEEFSVILPEATIEQGVIVAEKIRETVGGHEFNLNENNKVRDHITVSLGVSTLNGEVEDITELINQADVALYRAKRSGRNRVVSY